MRFRGLLSLVLSGFAIQAQDPPGQEDYLIRSDVNMILMHATVLDGQGGFVSGLKQDAFKVTEDGVPQTITVFRSDDVPVAAGIVIDHSGSMVRRRPDVVTGALSFARDSNPADQLFVVNFNNVARLGLPPEQPFSSSIHEIRTAIFSLDVGGQTALYDAIGLAVEHVQKASLMKRVLLVVSDGADNRSRRTLDEVTKAADRAGVLIYTIGLFDEYSEDRNPGVLRKLARQTGGLSFFPKETSEVTGICSQIAKDVRNQYTLGYMSSKAALDAAYHEVKVSAVDERRRSLKVRTRTGYFGAKAHTPAPAPKETVPSSPK